MPSTPRRPLHPVPLPSLCASVELSRLPLVAPVTVTCALRCLGLSLCLRSRAGMGGDVGFSLVACPEILQPFIFLSVLEHAWPAALEYFSRPVPHILGAPAPAWWTFWYCSRHQRTSCGVEAGDELPLDNCVSLPDCLPFPCRQAGDRGAGGRLQASGTLLIAWPQEAWTVGGGEGQAVCVRTQSPYFTMILSDQPHFPAASIICTWTRFLTWRGVK